MILAAHGERSAAARPRRAAARLRRATLALLAPLAMLIPGEEIAAQATSTPSRVEAPTPTASPPATRGPAGADVPGSALIVSLITIGQGDVVWEKFGHNAIRVRDLETGMDVAYNWGMFDFEQPNFLGRFLTGDTRYWMEGFDAPTMIAAYARQNRSVWEQELNLAPATRAELRAFLEWNALEENKYYRYDYYRDNCSTRVRDAIDRAAAGTLRRATADVSTTTTYRSHTRRLTRGDPAVYTGIQLALGEPADTPLSLWEESFLPTRLRQHVRRATVLNEAGDPGPMVGAERELFRATRVPEAAGPPDYTLAYLLTGVLLALLVVSAARGALRGRRAGGYALAAVGGALALIAGAMGTALLLAGTVTRHVFMGHNENLLLVNPLHLLLAALLPVAALTARRRGARLAAAVAIAIGALAVIAVLLKALPSFDQRNAEPLALLVPLDLALAWATVRLSRAPARATR